MREVVALWRYPVKSMQGEALDAATIGPRADRRRPRLGRRRHETGLALTGRRAPDLLFAHAALVGDDVRITLPDGSIAADDAALSAWLGRPVAHPGRRRLSGRTRSGSPRATTPTATRRSSGTGGKDPPARSTTRPAPRCRSSAPRPSATGTCAGSAPTCDRRHRRGRLGRCDAPASVTPSSTCRSRSTAA